MAGVAYWTDERIVEAVRSWADKNGRAPNPTEWQKGTADWPARNTVYNRFGSWGGMLEAAGLDPDGQARFEWTRETIIDAMLDHLFREGKWPSSTDWQYATDDRPAASTVIRQFGSWLKAKRAAGYSPKKGASRGGGRGQRAIGPRPDASSAARDA